MLRRCVPENTTINEVAKGIVGNRSAVRAFTRNFPSTVRDILIPRLELTAGFVKYADKVGLLGTLGLMVSFHDDFTNYKGWDSVGRATVDSGTFAGSIIIGAVLVAALPVTAPTAAGIAVAAGVGIAMTALGEGIKRLFL